MVRGNMAQRFVVRGGQPLKGTVRPAGNKNAALPIIASALLTDEPTEVRNVPRIRDVGVLLQILGDLGVTVEWTGDNTLRIDPAGLRHQAPSPALCAQLRASVLLAGPLLARHGSVTLPPPGGDVIGRRRLDTHFLAFERLGAEVEIGDAYQVTARALTGTDVFLDEPSVTATENALMAAVLAEGRTVLRNAACEPHVQDLARGLVAMGAQINGIGTNVLTIEGVDRLSGASIEIGPDHIEVGSFIGLAAVTDGDVTVEGVRPDDLQPILLPFDRLGVRPRIDDDQLHIATSQERRIRPDLDGHVPKIEDGPWPAFPADLTSIAVVVATQCDGVVMVFEKMFESRLFFVDKLVALGARAVLCDPHRVVISGPARLRGG